MRFNVSCVRNSDYMGENNTRGVYGEEIAPEETIEEYSSKPVISIYYFLLLASQALTYSMYGEKLNIAPVGSPRSCKS